MRKNIYWVLIFLNSLSVAQNIRTMELCSNWKFQYENSEYPAKVPGCIHTDLFQHHLISDPFFGDNEKYLQWIGQKQWIYVMSFTPDSGIFTSKNIELFFEGIDTYGDIFLNGEKILGAQNMFVSYKINIKKLLKRNNNELKIIFHPLDSIGNIEAVKTTYKLPEEPRVFFRKAQYQFGWDWGPKFTTCGIWKSIYIKAWDNFCITDIQIVQEEVATDFANLNALISIDSDTTEPLSITVKDLNSGVVLALKKMQTSSGKLVENVPIRIDNPIYWWCNGMGNPHLYSFLVEVADNKGNIQSKVIRYGIRTLRVVRETDLLGSGFGIELNGVPVFAKGANIIPLRFFPSEADSNDYRLLLKNAVHSNMNMLRVWGGGMYENNYFYDLCDSLGIMVWQDFMFACAMYPGDEHFLKNVRQEVVQQIIRLRNHSCIGLWCGNNEISEGWHNWGWQKSLEYSALDSSEVWNSYQKLFLKLIPDIIDSLDGNRFYWHSSPSIGWGRKESLKSGDIHYWGVWWGMEPFEMYKQKVGRFVSEFGFQGLPEYQSFEKFIPNEYLHLDSAPLKSHQKHPKGFETITAYMERSFQPAKDFQDYIYKSQLLQADGITMAIEAHRRAKPYCMGSLYWQMNDCWPAISWSGVDYYGKWKPMQYAVEKAFDNLLLSFSEDDSNLKLFAISDTIVDLEFHLNLSLLNFKGKEFWKSENEFVLKANSSQLISIVNPDTVIKYIGRDSIFMMAEIKNNHYTRVALHYFLPPKKLSLKETKIDIEYIPIDNGVEISLKTDYLMKGVFLSIKNGNAKFSDNYFDLIPNKKKTVFCLTELSVNELQKKINVTFLK